MKHDFRFYRIISGEYRHPILVCYHCGLTVRARSRKHYDESRCFWVHHRILDAWRETVDKRRKRKQKSR